MNYVAKLWWLKPKTFLKFKSHSNKSWVENNLNEQDSFSKQNLDQNSWKILMLFVFSTEIVNNFWDITLDTRPLALKMFEAKTFEAEISDANLATNWLSNIYDVNRYSLEQLWIQDPWGQRCSRPRPLRPDLWCKFIDRKGVQIVISSLWSPATKVLAGGLERLRRLGIWIHNSIL